MTAKQLIKELEKCHPESTVVISCGDSISDKIETVDNGDFYLMDSAQGQAVKDLLVGDIRKAE